MERTSRLVTPCQLQLLLQVDARFNSNAKTLDGTQNTAFRCNTWAASNAASTIAWAIVIYTLHC
jgi:hypothetical protein